MPTLTEILAAVLRQFRVRTPEELARDHPCMIGVDSEAPDEIFVPETGQGVMPPLHPDVCRLSRRRYRVARR